MGGTWLILPLKVWKYRGIASQPLLHLTSSNFMPLLFTGHLFPEGSHSQPIIIVVSPAKMASNSRLVTETPIKWFWMMYKLGHNMGTSERKLGTILKHITGYMVESLNISLIYLSLACALNTSPANSTCVGAILDLENGNVPCQILTPYTFQVIRPTGSIRRTFLIYAN